MGKSAASKFWLFSEAVALNIRDLMKGREVFAANVEGEALWQTYLSAFPEGANPIFRKRTEHDCSCCRHFIRRVGGMVAIEGDEVQTVWQRAVKTLQGEYRVVATAMDAAVREAGIGNIFRAGKTELAFGAQTTTSLNAENNVVRWEHFYTPAIQPNLRATSPDQERGDYRTAVQTLERGLVELDPHAIETVLSLIKSNSLYRGEEHKSAVQQFQKLQREYRAKDSKLGRDLFVWQNAGGPAARFRNSVIGTLIQDLSEGRDLDEAVTSFESKVAPQNYKRTTALITPGMVKQAMKTIEELGLESALERRFAVIGDVSVNDVKWVDNEVKPLMKGGIGDALMQHATASQVVSAVPKLEQISIDDFLAKVLPESTGLEILFKGEHLGNLMSLTAPCHPEPKQLFRWSNDFAWSYSGNVADSIKERVKKAGGRVEGVLRVSLSWFNYDDLDLHVYEPAGRGIHGHGMHIYFRNKRGWTGGTLDVDMNAGHGTTREPVENVIWPATMPDGAYRVVVHNYHQRETTDPGFTIEVENSGNVFHYSYNKILRSEQEIEVVTLHMKGGVLQRAESNSAISPTSISQERWGLKTERYIKVRAVMLSPNYWGDNVVGNKHTFFVLEGAKNDEPTRGFYNEFLHPRLEPHRKVFEVIADKTKCQPTEGQLSGLGFSSTKPASFVVRAQQGKKQRMFQVRVAS